MDQKCPVAYVAIQLPSTGRGYWDRQRAKSTGGQFACPLWPEGRGSRPASRAGPLVPVESQRQWGAVRDLARALALYRAVTLLSVHIALPTPASQSGQKTLQPQRQGQMRWGKCRQDLFSVAPKPIMVSRTCKSSVPSVLKEMKSPSLPLIPFFIWESKGRLFLYSQHFWQVCASHEIIPCSLYIQFAKLQLNSFWTLTTRVSEDPQVKGSGPRDCLPLQNPVT